MWKRSSVIINIDKKMDELKIFGLNIGALLVSVMPNLNPILQTIVLLLTIIYTILMIIKKAKELKK